MALTLSFQEHSFVEDLVGSAAWWRTSPLPESLLLICFMPVGSHGLDKSKFSSQEAKATDVKTVHHLFKSRGVVFNSFTFVFLCKPGNSAWFKSLFPIPSKEEVGNPWGHTSMSLHQWQLWLLLPIHWSFLLDQKIWYISDSLTPGTGLDREKKTLLALTGLADQLPFNSYIVKNNW